MIRRTKDGRYYIAARVRIDGKIVWKQETLKCTKNEAQHREIAMKDELRTGSKTCSLISKKISTFADVIDIYVACLQSKGTFSKPHEKKISKIRRDLGTISVNDFADRFEVWLKLECMVVRDRFGNAIPGRSASPAKRNRIIEIVRAAFNVAVDLKKVSDNPIDRKRFPKMRTVPRDEYISNDEINAILDVAKNERPYLYPILKYAFQVPCRKEELVRATRDDLDLFSGVIRIRNGCTKNDEGIYKPIPPNMVDYFRSLPKDTQYLFYRRDDEGVCRPLGDFRHAYLYCLKRAGVEKITFHATRHISATNMVDNGTPERIVMSVAGWKTNMLRDYYHREPKEVMKRIKWSQCELNVNSSEAKNA